MPTPSPQFVAFVDAVSEAQDDPSQKDGALSNSDVQTMWSELGAFGCRSSHQMPRGTIDDRTAAMRRRLQKKMAARKAAKEQA